MRNKSKGRGTTNSRTLSLSHLVGSGLSPRSPSQLRSGREIPETRRGRGRQVRVPYSTSSRTSNNAGISDRSEFQNITDQEAVPEEMFEEEYVEDDHTIFEPQQEPPAEIESDFTDAADGFSTGEMEEAPSSSKNPNVLLLPQYKRGRGRPMQRSSTRKRTIKPVDVRADSLASNQLDADSITPGSGPPSVPSTPSAKSGRSKSGRGRARGASARATAKLDAIVKQEDPDSCDSMAEASSSRPSRNRQPSRKILESRGDLDMQSPPRKKQARNRKSSSLAVSVSESSQSLDDEDTTVVNVQVDDSEQMDDITDVGLMKQNIDGNVEKNVRSKQKPRTGSATKFDEPISVIEKPSETESIAANMLQKANTSATFVLTRSEQESGIVFDSVLQDEDDDGVELTEEEMANYVPARELGVVRRTQWRSLKSMQPMPKYKQKGGITLAQAQQQAEARKREAQNDNLPRRNIFDAPEPPPVPPRLSHMKAKTRAGSGFTKSTTVARGSTLAATSRPSAISSQARFPIRQVGAVQYVDTQVPISEERIIAEDLTQEDFDDDEAIEPLQPSISLEKPTKRPKAKYVPSARSNNPPIRLVTPDSIHSARGSMVHSNVKSRAAIAASIPIISATSINRGLDLPDEHRPRQRAQHVVRAGLVPNMKDYNGPLETAIPQTIQRVLIGGDIDEGHLIENEPRVLIPRPAAPGSSRDQVPIIQQRDIGVHQHADITDQEQRDQQEDQLEHVEGENIVFEEGFIDDVQREEVIENNPKEELRYVTMVDTDGNEVVIELVEGQEIGEDGQIIDTRDIAMQDEMTVAANTEVVQENVEEFVEDQSVIGEQGDVKPEHIRFDTNENNADGNEVFPAANHDDDDDDMPPQLVPEEVQDEEVVNEAQRRVGYNLLNPTQLYQIEGQDGIAHIVHVEKDADGNDVFVDEHGLIVDVMADENQQLIASEVVLSEQRVVQNIGLTTDELRNIEFNFLDTRNICCGLCGEIVPYETLITEHLPTSHPEMIENGINLEEVPYENWLRDRLRREVKAMENGFRPYQDSNSYDTMRLLSRGLRQLRKVSQIRVNPSEMTLQQLEIALKRKMIEKLGRKVAVSLVDKYHARCGICQSVVSLNKKFEVIHLVRHFNAWHPAEHRCTGRWRETSNDTGGPKQLSLHDFAVLDVDSDVNNLQCIWCGMMMDRVAIGMHFAECHTDEVEVPKCSLCLQEMVLAARMIEKWGEDFGVSMPDEYHVRSTRLNAKFSSEKHLDRAIEKFAKRRRGELLPEEEEEDGEEHLDGQEQEAGTTNSRQNFGRRNKLKRSFVKPCFRQVCPPNSTYFEPLSASEWKCKLCGEHILGAVMSAGAIRHYKTYHPIELENMQYELVRARLDRISDGSMEFVHPQLVECLVCNMTYVLHKPYNLCRAVRHLKLKHKEVMPEYTGEAISNNEPRVPRIPISLGEVITEPEDLEKFRLEYNADFDKVQVLYGVNGSREPVYVLMCDDDVVMDEDQAKLVASAMAKGEKVNKSLLPSDGSTSPTMEGEYEVEEGVVEEEQYIQDTVMESVEDVQVRRQEARRHALALAQQKEKVSAKQRHVLAQRRRVDEEIPQEIVEQEEMVMEQIEHENVEHHIMGQNEMGEQVEYVYGEMIQMGENEGEYEIIEQVIQDDQYNEAVAHEQYLTEEEMRAAAERGELQYEEFVDEHGNPVAYEQYEEMAQEEVEEQHQQ